MSKFHSTVSRRDFMKGLGLTGAGLGAAAAVAPSFHDLDEVISSSVGGRKRSWWIKETDTPKSCEVDFNEYVRCDAQGNGGHAGVYYKDSLMKTLKGGSADNYKSEGRTLTIEHWQKNFPHLNWKGDTTRDVALNQACSICRMKGQGWLGFQKAVPPREQNYAQRGPMPDWNGTAEENFRMIQQVGIFCGAASVGVMEINEQTKKFIYGIESSGREVVFEDVDMPYTTNSGGVANKGKKVIPTSWKSVIYHLYTAPTEMAKRFPSLLARSALDQIGTYQVSGGLVTQEFVRGLGYHTCTIPAHTAPIGIFTGIGEHSRMGYNIVSPEYGATARRVNMIATNLPLTPTKPIDGGIARFCLTCKLCAEEGCPYGCLPLGDPDWDYKRVPGSPPGFKGWRMDAAQCAHCGSACQGVCPFNAVNESVLHSVVKASVASTSVLNGFFRNMEVFMGYGPASPDTWWELDNEPSFGFAPKMLMPAQQL